jgi:aminoglycoside 3-N-acetyltransferase
MATYRRVAGGISTLRATLYHLVRRTVSQERRNQLKVRIAHWRTRFAPVYRARHGTFDAGDLKEELARHLPAEMEIVMVHCSFNDLLPMYTGSVKELLDALIDLCRPEQTLVMPAFFFGGAEGDPRKHYRKRPLFDVRRQPSEMGILSELFRRRPDVRRSLHPTASVSALGPLAEEVTENHHLATTIFGEGTPFGRMAERRTTIFGIGTEYFRSLSQVHAAEDLLGERYPLELRPLKLRVQLRDFDGELHDYELPVKSLELGRRMERLEQLLTPNELVQWRFHGVPLFATSASRVTDVLVEAALREETIYDAMPIRDSRPRLRPNDSA